MKLHPAEVLASNHRLRRLLRKKIPLHIVVPGIPGVTSKKPESLFSYVRGTISPSPGVSNHDLSPSPLRRHKAYPFPSSSVCSTMFFHGMSGPYFILLCRFRSVRLTTVSGQYLRVNRPVCLVPGRYWGRYLPGSSKVRRERRLCLPGKRLRSARSSCRLPRSPHPQDHQPGHTQEWRHQEW